LFAPESLDATITALLTASEEDETAAARIDAARRIIDDCTTRLARYRAAIEEGVDPKIVATWIADVEGERLAAQQVLADFSTQTPDEDALRAMIENVDVAEMLVHANATDKAALYADLGLTLTYRPSERTVLAEARPVYVARVGGA